MDEERKEGNSLSTEWSCAVISHLRSIEWRGEAPSMKEQPYRDVLVGGGMHEVWRGTYRKRRAIRSRGAEGYC